MKNVYIEERTQPKTKKVYVGIWRLTKYGCMC